MERDLHFVTSLLHYSDLNEFTGLAVAALIDSKLTVNHAMNNADKNAITKIVQSMFT